jgi:hypothetical protein
MSTASVTVKARSSVIESQLSARPGGGIINPGSVPAVTTAAVTERREGSVNRYGSIVLGTFLFLILSTKQHPFSAAVK